MALAICDISAALYWEALGSEAFGRMRRLLIPDHVLPPRARDISSAVRLIGLSDGESLHVLQCSQNDRRILSGCSTHSCEISLPTGSLYGLDDELLIACPELTFIQMAHHLSFEHLVHFGMMLCGIYAREFVPLTQSSWPGSRHGAPPMQPSRVTYEPSRSDSEDSEFTSSPSFVGMSGFVGGGEDRIHPRLEQGYSISGYRRMMPEFSRDVCQRQPYAVGSQQTQQSDRPGTKRRLSRRRPLTTVAGLRAYLDFARGMNGVKAARKAVPYIVEQSRSPMESSLAMSLCLPYKYGGYALPQPRLNARVYLSGGDSISGGVRRDESGRPYFECDLVWEEQKVIVEYHGDESHFSREGVAKDVRKANLLASMGYKVYAATLDIFASPLKFHEFATRVRLALKRKFQPGVQDFDKRAIALREALRVDYLQEYRKMDAAKRNSL